MDQMNMSYMLHSQDQYCTVPALMRVATHIHKSIGKSDTFKSTVLKQLNTDCFVNGHYVRDVNFIYYRLHTVTSSTIGLPRTRCHCDATVG